MNQTSKYYLKVTMLVVFAVLITMSYNHLTQAGGHYSKKTNMSDMADLMSKWSKQLGSGKCEPTSQAKISQLMAEMSEVIRNYASGGSGKMDMDHHKKIETMKEEWDPFDTSDKM